MPEDPIAQSEIAALTRRMEEMERRLTGLIQTQGIQLAMTLGERLGASEKRLETLVKEEIKASEERVSSRIESLDSKADALKQHIDHRNAQLIEEIARHIGKSPDAE